MTLSTLPLAITMGDPAGIGPEIIAKLAATERLSTPYVVIGDAGARRAAASLGLTLHIRELPASLAGWDEAWRWGRPPSIPPALRCRRTCPRQAR
ncbi:hypothetical protein M5585_21645 [Serratia ureilytica]